MKDFIKILKLIDCSKNIYNVFADLLGHESIDTTRIYVRKTATEQKEIVDKIVTW